MELANIIAYYKGQFPNLTDDDIAAILSISKIKTIQKDGYLIRIHEFKPIIALVVTGIIRGLYYTEKGQEMSPFFWAENQITASWETIYLQQPSQLDFQAIEECQLLTIDYLAFKKAMDKFPNLQKVYIDMVEIIFANTLQHQQQYSNAKPEKRYTIFKERSPHLIHRVSDKHLAAHLGITPISFSRMKKRLG